MNSCCDKIELWSGPNLCGRRHKSLRGIRTFVLGFNFGAPSRYQAAERESLSSAQNLWRASETKGFKTRLRNVHVAPLALLFCQEISALLSSWAEKSENIDPRGTLFVGFIGRMPHHLFFVLCLIKSCLFLFLPRPKVCGVTGWIAVLRRCS